MRRILSILLALTLLVSLLLIFVFPVPASAVTPPLNVPDMPEIPDISDDIEVNLPDGIFDDYIPDIELPDMEPTEPPVDTGPCYPSLCDWLDWFRQWFHRLPGCGEKAELDTPDITEARYYHGKYSRLQISWKDVENAESYDVEITKADGTVMEYRTDSTTLILWCECPAIYVEETATWAAATVRVRAVCGDTVGEWNEGGKIGCDSLHVLEKVEAHDD